MSEHDDRVSEDREDIREDHELLRVDEQRLRRDQEQLREDERRSTVHVNVMGPSDLETKEFTFEKTLLVGKAAKRAADDMGYNAASPTFQNSEKQVLDRAKTLEASGVNDGDTLELVDAGGGV